MRLATKGNIKTLISLTSSKKASSPFLYLKTCIYRCQYLLQVLLWKRKHFIHQCIDTAICWSLIYVHVMYLLEESLEQSMTMEATNIHEILHQEKSWQVAILVMVFSGSCSIFLLHRISGVSFPRVGQPCSGPQPCYHASGRDSKFSKMALIFLRSDWQSPLSCQPDNRTEHFNNLQGFKMLHVLLSITTDV